ncbi:delta-like protein 1 [Actinia tenebrosa]|uniref:Delta-like protein 1 n=1 Tax=Actinia tenebrosa TaxID=6105 RepID=A0A6P8J3M0_ACTTE|nr:delta-like protein 1 [Actinia tenebrosa]
MNRKRGTADKRRQTLTDACDVNVICALLEHSNTLKCVNLRQIPKFTGNDLKAGTLKLGRNSITLVQSNAFLDFTILRYIFPLSPSIYLKNSYVHCFYDFRNLSRNAIDRVEPRAFSHREYEWIDLSFNKLRTLGRDAFPDDETLKRKSLQIYLHDNPWDCTCALKWLIDLMKDTLIRPLLRHPTCATPQKLKGIRLVEVQDQDYCVIKECSECDDAADCVIYNNKYACICRPSYDGNGKYCADKDECAVSSTNNCKVNELCENFAGGYQCVCSGGFQKVNGECVDIDECAPPPVGCGPGQGTCKNTIGSYQCTCNPGLKYSDQGCVDFDECKSKSDPCKDISHSTCVNKAIIAVGDQGYSCQCNEGYIKSGDACVFKDDPNRKYIIIGAGSGVIVLAVILIIIICILCKRRGSRKKEEKEPEFVIAPVTMTTPIDFAFMDVPQGQAQDLGNEEWNEMDSDDL